LKTNNKYREAIFYKDHFYNFYNVQNNRVKAKILWTIKIIEELKIIPSNYFKYLKGSNGIYEIRIQVGTNIFRILCFFDNDDLIIIGNGFQKKSQKTDPVEIEKAQKIKSDYEKEKNK